MTTPVYITGFEHGLASLSTNGAGLANAIVGSPEIQSTTVYSGSYAMRCYNSSATSTNYQVYLSDTNAYTVSSFYLYVKTMPSAKCIIWVGGNTSAGAYGYIKLDPSDNKLEFTIGTSTGNKSQALSTEQWYKVDVHYDISTATNKIKGKVAGTDVTEFSTSLLQGTTFSVRMGLGYGESITGEIFFDDIIVSETSADYPIPEAKVAGLRPDSDGTHNAGTNIMEDGSGNDIDGSTYTAYSLLDENPWTSSISDYVRQYATGTSNYVQVNFEDLPVSASSVLGVNAVLQYSSDGTKANSAKTYITTVDGQQELFSGDMSESSAFYKKLLVPAPTAGWTTTNVNSLTGEMGYASDASPYPFWSALILEVAYTETSGSGTNEYNESIALGRVEGASNSKAISYTSSLNIGKAQGTTNTSTASYTASLSIGKAQGVSDSGGLSFQDSLSFGKNISMSDTNTMTFNVSTNLAKSIYTEISPSFIYEVATGLARNIFITANIPSVTNYEEDLDLNKSIGVSNSNFMSIEQQILFAKLLTTAVVSQLSIEESVALEKQNAVQIANNVSLEISVNLGKYQSVSTAGGLSFAEAISLASQMAVIISEELGKQSTTPDIRISIIAPDVRVITVSVENRQIVLSVQDRVMTVEQDNRINNIEPDTRVISIKE